MGSPFFEESRTLKAALIEQASDFCSTAAVTQQKRQLFLTSLLLPGKISSLGMNGSSVQVNVDRCECL